MKVFTYQIMLFLFKIKVHEVYVKEIPQRKALMTIEDEDEENEDLTKEDLLPEEE